MQSVFAYGIFVEYGQVWHNCLSLTSCAGDLTSKILWFNCPNWKNFIGSWNCRCFYIWWLSWNFFPPLGRNVWSSFEVFRVLYRSESRFGNLWQCFKSQFQRYFSGNSFRSETSGSKTSFSH